MQSIQMKTPEQRIEELEQEVKCLTRLVKEMAAREKLNTGRLQAVSRDHAQTARQVKALDLAAKKSDSRLAQVHASVQRVTSR